LIGVLCVSPAGLMRLDVGFGFFPERNQPRSFGISFDLLGLSRFNGIDARGNQLTGVQCGLARLCEAERDDRTKAHVAGAPVPLEPKDPRARAVSADLQVETRTISVQTRAV
jgi:hypothetical protein